MGRNARSLPAGGSKKVKLNVKVITRARRPGITVLASGDYVIKVAAPAEDGRANGEVVKRLADHFSVPRRAVRIIHGAKKSHKVIDVDAE